MVEQLPLKAPCYQDVLRGGDVGSTPASTAKMCIWILKLVMSDFNNTKTKPL